MHYRTILVALPLSIWITVTLPQTAKGGFATDTEQKYAQEIHKALNDLDIPLNEQEKASIAGHVVKLCRTQEYVYTAQETKGFIASLQSSMSHNWGGLPTSDTPAQTKLRELRIRENLLHLQTGMAYYERSQGVNATSSQQPSLSDDFWKHIDTLASEHFTSVPDATRQQQLVALRTSWQAIENNRFTPSGKRALTAEDTEQLLNQLTQRAQTLDEQLRDHLKRVPDDVKAGLMEFYLNELLSSVIPMCQARTVLALPGEVNDSLRSAMVAITQQLQDIHARRTTLLNAQHRQIMERLAEEDAKYKVDRMLVEIGVRSVDQLLDESVRNIECTLPSATTVGDPSALSVGNLASSQPIVPLSESAKVASASLCTTSMAVTWAIIVVASIACVLIVCVILLRWRRRSKLGVLLLFALSSYVMAMEPSPQSTTMPTTAPTTSPSHELLLLANEAGLSGSTLTEWSNLVDKALAKEGVRLTDGFRMIKPALLQDLSRVSRGQMPAPIQRVYMSFVRDVAVESLQHDTPEATIKLWPDVFRKFCITMGPSSLSDVTNSAWGDSVSLIIRDDVQTDRYKDFYATIWDETLANDIARQWQAYCDTHLKELMRGRSYGRRISGNSQLGEDRDFTEAIARRLFIMSRAVIRNAVTTPDTRTAYRQARIALTKGDDGSTVSTAPASGPANSRANNVKGGTP